MKFHCVPCPNTVGKKAYTRCEVIHWTNKITEMDKDM